MDRGDGDTSGLIGRIALGDPDARERLLAKVRARLRRMIASRMDGRLSPRVDPSDVVQEALAEVDRSLASYSRDRPIPLVPWLRRLSWERLVEARRRHIDSGRRSVSREERGPAPHPSRVDGGDSPSGRAVLEESRGQVRAHLERLPPRDRELLEMRYFEQRSIGEIAEALGISPGAVMTRHTRALARLRSQIEAGSAGGRP